MIVTRLSWLIHGWSVNFPYSSSEIQQNPSCLLWKESPNPRIMANACKDLISWSPPAIGSLKWNVASFDPSLSQAAVGGVLRSDAGIILCIFSSPIPAIQINSAEVFAILRAIKITLASDRIKSSSIIIESDSRNAVHWCNQDSGGPWNLGFALNFIMNSRKAWLNICINKGRESNHQWYG